VGWAGGGEEVGTIWSFLLRSQCDTWRSVATDSRKKTLVVRHASAKQLHISIPPPLPVGVAVCAQGAEDPGTRRRKDGVGTETSGMATFSLSLR
jgi:hypothetical protein